MNWWIAGLMGWRIEALSHPSNHPKIQSSGFHVSVVAGGAD
jgi:hypothetical protein